VRGNPAKLLVTGCALCSRPLGALLNFAVSTFISTFTSAEDLASTIGLGGTLGFAARWLLSPDELSLQGIWPPARWPSRQRCPATDSVQPNRPIMRRCLRRLDSEMKARQMRSRPAATSTGSMDTSGATQNIRPDHRLEPGSLHTRDSSRNSRPGLNTRRQGAFHRPLPDHITRSNDGDHAHSETSVLRAQL